MTGGETLGLAGGAESEMTWLLSAEKHTPKEIHHEFVCT